MLFWLFIVALRIGEGEITISIQDSQEHFYVDLMAQYPSYQNVQYSIEEVKPLNEFTRKKAEELQEPCFTAEFSTVLKTHNNIAINDTAFCPIAQYNLNTLPFTFFVSRALFTVIILEQQDDEMRLQRSQDYDLSRLKEGIVCTAIYGKKLDFVVYVDCEADSLFYTITVDLLVENQELKGLNFSIAEYRFQGINKLGDPNAYWSKCFKKNIKFLQDQDQLKAIFYCLKNYHEGDDDALIFVENAQIGNTIEVFVYTKSHFSSCTKSSSSNPAFQLQQLLVNSYVAGKSLLDHQKAEIWTIALLISERDGICKCGEVNLGQISCQFLELQEGNYTELYATSYIDEITHLYVMSQTFIYRVFVAISWKVNEDRIDAYYNVKQEATDEEGLIIYFPIKMYLYNDFILVLMSGTRSSSPQDQTVQYCLKKESEVQFTRQLVFYNRFTETIQQNPNFIYNIPFPFYNVRYQGNPGNYLIEWNVLSELVLFEIQNHLLNISGKCIVELNNYLHYNLTLMISDMDDSSKVYANDYIELIIVKFNDKNFFILDNNSQMNLSFKQESYEFQLNEGLVGPLLDFHDVAWNDPESVSTIEYIRGIQISNVSRKFQKIFNGKFIYNGFSVYLMLLGTLQQANQQILGYQKFNYSSVKREFTSDSDLIQLSLGEYTFSYIDFVQMNIFTMVIGNLQECNLILCYIQQFDACYSIGGDFNKSQPYIYVEVLEETCYQDLIFAVPESAKEFYAFTYDCPEINRKSSFQNVTLTKQIGLFDKNSYPQLENQIILDAYFHVLDGKLSFLLIDNGEILQLKSEISVDSERITFHILNRIRTSKCVPHYNTSSIFLLSHNQETVLIFVCFGIQQSAIYEYQMLNPITPIFRREYPLYNFQVNTIQKCFTDQKVLYIPIGDLEYLAYNPFIQSPNILLHAIDIAMSNQVSAIPVLINNENSKEWDIFSMAFFYNSLNGFLFYLNEKPVYYGKMDNSSIKNSEKLILVYQQNNEKLLFRQFELNFNYSLAEIDYKPTQPVDVNDSRAIVKIQPNSISGAVEDYTIEIKDNKDVVYQKLDILEINKYLCEHYETLEFGVLFDVLDLGDPNFDSIMKNNPNNQNLIFAISQYYLVVIEKQNLVSNQSIKVLIQVSLKSISQSLINLKTCKLSINYFNEIILYCYEEHISSLYLDLVQLAQYYLVQFEYNPFKISLGEKFNILANNSLTINLGSRVQIENIDPILFDNKVLQLIQYNYENSPDQYELVAGEIQNNTLTKSQVLESSSNDGNLIGQLAFDAQPLPDGQEFILVTIAGDKLKMQVMGFNNTAQKFISLMQTELKYDALNASLFNSQTHKNMVTIQLLGQTKSRIEILLGTEDAFYEFTMLKQGPTNNFTIKPTRTYNNYFQCKNSKSQHPAVQVNTSSSFIHSLVAACVKESLEKNFFFEDNFQYNYDHQLVYVQIFQNNLRTQQITSPMRVYKFFENVNRKQFHFTMYRQRNGGGSSLLSPQWHILFENATYFLVDYIKHEDVSFVMLCNSAHSEQINVTLTLFNYYTSFAQNLSIQFTDARDDKGFNIWILFGIVTGGVLVLVLLVALLSKLWAKRKTAKHTRVADRTNSLEMLDEAVRAVVAQDFASKRLKAEESDSD